MSIRSMIEKLRTPSSRYAAGTILGASLVLGVVGFLSFDQMIHETSSDAFCLTCHADEIGLETGGRTHYENATGFRATCEDCHLPREYVPKLIEKARAGSKDVFHEFVLGTLSTHEKFEAHRMAMATAVWTKMKNDDSRNCRYCHVESQWDLSEQTQEARESHEAAPSNDETCIDCHKGVAHALPEGIDADDRLEASDF